MCIHLKMGKCLLKNAIKILQKNILSKEVYINKNLCFLVFMVLVLFLLCTFVFKKTFVLKKRKQKLFEAMENILKFVY